MAMQTAFRRFAHSTYEKCVPALLAVSRNSHNLTYKLGPSHLTQNLFISHPCAVLQSTYIGETAAPSLLEGWKHDPLLLTLVNQKQYFDLDLLKPEQRRMYMPSTSLNKIKIYEEKHYGILKTIMDPLLKDNEVVHIPVPGQSTKKEAHRMINIRKRKMRVHKRKKLKKRMKFVWEKMYMRREIRKETAFRLELLTQIDEAQSFNAEKYIKGVIDKIRYHEKPLTSEERREQYRLLVKKNKSNTKFIKPRFDD